MTELAYCPTCMEPMPFTTARKTILIDYEGRRYRYFARKAFCRTCGSEATYPPYQEESGQKFNEAVRKQEGLTSLDVIREIPKRYDIGKRPLSRVLGLGEHTYAQLMEGQAPSRAHSDLIDHVERDPGYYLSLLEARKDRIGNTTYLRSRRAAQSYMQRDGNGSYRVFELGRTLVHLMDGDVTAMALQKLAYYVQAFSKPLLGHYILDEMPSAWAKGPVYEQLWREYRDSPSTYLAYDSQDSSSPFTPAEDELIRAVSLSFGCYSGSSLGRMTHEETPWVAARRRAGASAGERCGERLREDDMSAFFGGIVRRYAMTGAGDIGRYAADAFAKAMA